MTWIASAAHCRKGIAKVETKRKAQRKARTGVVEKRTASKAKPRLKEQKEEESYMVARVTESDREWARIRYREAADKKKMILILSEILLIDKEAVRDLVC